MVVPLSADRHDGCIVCHRFLDEMLHLSSGAMTCRPCAARVASFIATAPDTTLSRLWRDSNDEPPPARTPSGEEELLAEFRRGVQRIDLTIQAHQDLADAYREMGLVADALRELATGLAPEVSHHIAQTTFEWMFGPRYARPEALASVVRALARN